MSQPPYGPPPTVNVYQKKGGGCGIIAIVLIILAVFAVVGFVTPGIVTPGIVALVAAVQDSSPAGQHVSVAEWVGIIAACFITAGAVFAVPNLPRNPPEPAE